MPESTLWKLLLACEPNNPGENQDSLPNGCLELHFPCAFGLLNDSGKQRVTVDFDCHGGTVPMRPVDESKHFCAPFGRCLLTIPPKFRRLPWIVVRYRI